MQKSSARTTLSSGAPITLPCLSVVVIGRNEGSRLAQCLESIRRVRGVSIGEVIYVDSDSTDGSPELAGRHGATVIPVRSGRPTAAMGRNAGWRHARRGLVLFLDGDTVLEPDFPRLASEAMENDTSIAAVWGHRREIHPEASIYNRVLDLDWIYPAGFTEFCGGDVLMRREVLQQTGGFDERLIAGEEPELCRRLRARGHRILHIDHAMTGHDLQIVRWSQYWKRATRAGHAYAEVSDRFRQSDDPFWLADRRRNVMRGGFWVVSFAAALLAGLRFGVLPGAVWLALVLAMSLRTAWKARWKGARPWVLLLYGLHSHLQQVPILAGQMQYELGRRRGKVGRLIEYKEI